MRVSRAPTCGKPLKIRRAIEVGHVFKLGTKYSEKLERHCSSTKTGKQALPSWAATASASRARCRRSSSSRNDKDGIIWPMTVAPFTVCITPLGVVPGSAVMKLAEKIYTELTARGVDVILDDRDERPGVKFKDSELGRLSRSALALARNHWPKAKWKSNCAPAL